jgi:hypothetical protein
VEGKYKVGRQYARPLIKMYLVGRRQHTVPMQELLAPFVHDVKGQREQAKQKRPRQVRER